MRKDIGKLVAKSKESGKEGDSCLQYVRERHWSQMVAKLFW